MTADAEGGVWGYALQLCQAFATHDVDVLLAVMGRAPSGMQRSAVDRLENVRLVHGPYALEWMTQPWDEVDLAGKWLLDLAESFDPMLVHVNGFAHAAMPWSRPVVSVAHSCVWTWWRAVHGGDPPSEWSEYRHRVAAGLAHADAVVAPTRAFADQVAAAYVLTRPCTVVHNGRTVQGAGAVSGSNRLPIVIACGRAWDRAKNVEVLDAIADALPWHVYLMGNMVGPDGQYWHSRSLRCLGSLPDGHVQTWLQRASIFAHPALYEPFGLAVLEAAMAGCALVLADLPSLRELWTDAAEFFDPRDPLALQALLQDVIDAPQRRADLSVAAMERARTYSAAAMAEAYLRVYVNALSVHDQPRRAVA